MVEWWLIEKEIERYYITIGCLIDISWVTEMLYIRLYSENITKSVPTIFCAL